MLIEMQNPAQQCSLGNPTAVNKAEMLEALRMVAHSL